MRIFLLAAGLLACLALPRAHAVTLFDSGGFEAYANGDLVGQNGWILDGYDMSGADVEVSPLIVDTAPGGHGKAVEFANIGATESPISVNFDNITGKHAFAQASFDFYRDGAGLTNNFNIWPNGNNPWGSWIWKPAASAVAVVAPVGRNGVNTPMPVKQWFNVTLQYDLVNFTCSAWANGVQIVDKYSIGEGEFNGYYFNDWNRGLTAPGEKAWLDNFTLTAGDDTGAIPEPGTFALLGTGLLPLLALRRRR